MVIILGLTSTMSSGSRKIVAPSLRAQLIQYLNTQRHDSKQEEEEMLDLKETLPSIHNLILLSDSGVDDVPVD